LAGNRLNFGNPPTRPAPDAGRTFAFNPNVANDATVRTIWSVGRYPLGGIQPPQINRAVIGNVGTAALTNVPVTLTVSGVNSFSSTVTIANLPSGADTTVSFAAYTPINAGTDTVRVTLGADQNPANNTRFILQIVNNNGDFGYADSLSGISNNVGGALSFISAIRVAGSRSPGFNVFQVSSVSMIMGTDPTLVGSPLQPVVCSSNGTILGTGPTYSILSADLGQRVFLNFASPINVTDTVFYAGILKPDGTSYFPITTQAEIPVRTGLVYAFIPAAGGTPTEFSGATNFGRLTISTRYNQANVGSDLSVTDVFGSGRIPRGYGTDSVQMFARVRNLVGPTVTSLPVTLTVTGANPRSFSTNVAVSAGTTAIVTFPGYKPTSVGFDTVRVSIPNDGNNANNIATFIQEITPKTWHYHQVGSTATSFVGFNTTNAIDDELFLNRFLLNDTASAFVTKVFVQIGTGATIPGIRMRGVVKTAAGAVVGQSAERVLTAADAGTTLEFNIVRDLSAAPFGPNQAFFAGIMYSKPAGAAAFPVGFRTEDPIRPTGNPSFRASGIAGAPVVQTQPWIYQITAEVVNANAPNTITNFALVAPADNTSLTLAGPAATAVNISWNAATDPAATGPISYIFLIDAAGGFGLSTATQIQSNNGGLNPSLTLTYGQLDDLLEALQVPAGVPTSFDWTVVATSGANFRFATDTFTLTLTRGLVQFQLCTPSSTQNANDFINSFVLNGATATSINRVTGRNTPTQYRNLYDSTNVSLLPNTSYPFTITMGIGGPGNTLVGAFTYTGFAIIDWNNNNGFSIVNEGFSTNNDSGDTVLFQPAVLTGSITVPPGQANGPYRMRVIAGDVSGVIQPCQVQFGDVEDYKITVGPIVGIKSVEKFENSFFLYPNPAKDNVRLTYTYDKPSRMQLTVMNSVGATVLTREYSDLIDGQIDLSIEDLTSGIYFVRATVDGVNTIQKLIVE
jgi:hypothetical protein